MKAAGYLALYGALFAMIAALVASMAVIRSFRDKDTQSLFEGRCPRRGITGDTARRLAR